MTKSNRWLDILGVATLVVTLIGLYMAFVYAQTEVNMGLVYRIFFFHLGAVAAGFVAIVVVMIAGIAYLRTHSRAWDRVAEGAAEIGVLFCTVALIMGTIWARPIWGVWWTWDPRLTTFTILLLIYFAYLMLREGIEDPDRRARFASVYGIVGFISVPITWFSIRFWRTIHPVVIGSSDPSAKGSFNMEPQMLQTLLFSIAFFTVLYATLMWHRLRLESFAGYVAQLKARFVNG